MVINVRCLVIVLLMMIFTGCGMQPQSDNKSNDTYSVVDDYGNVLRFDSKPKKIYAGTLSIEELLVDLLLRIVLLQFLKMLWMVIHR